MRIIAGEWRGRRLSGLSGRSVRPTTDRVREAWMSALGGDLSGLTVLDLFAGSGALGLEALSRGARSAVFVENSKAARRALEANIELLGCSDRAVVVRGDAVRYARRAGRGEFDLAFADPPYGTGLAAAILDVFRGHPFAREIWVEHRFDEALPEPSALKSRRYGDTILSWIQAPNEPA